MYNALMHVPMAVIKQLATLTERRLLAAEEREGLAANHSGYAGGDSEEQGGGASAVDGFDVSAPTEASRLVQSQ